MFKIRKKNLIYLVSAIFGLLILSNLVSAVRDPVLNTSKYPINLLALIQREVGGIIFYHRNFVENERLRQESEALKQRLAESNEVNLENKRLNDALAFKKESSYRIVAARVIARSADNWYSSIIIDKGKRSGIKRGLVVVTYLGLVGRVVEAADSLSKVILIKDTSLSVSALVQRSRQEGLVCGALGNYLMMKYLPRDADIKIDDLIISSGLTQAYPKGLVIGSVIDVGDEFGGLTRYALIKPAVNLSSVEEVMVIIQ